MPGNKVSDQLNIQNVCKSKANALMWRDMQHGQTTEPAAQLSLGMIKTQLETA